MNNDTRGQFHLFPCITEVGGTSSPAKNNIWASAQASPAGFLLGGRGWTASDDGRGGGGVWTGQRPTLKASDKYLRPGDQRLFHESIQASAGQTSFIFIMSIIFTAAEMVSRPGTSSGSQQGVLLL